MLAPAGEAWSRTQGEAWRGGEETEGGETPAAGGTEKKRGGRTLQTKTGEKPYATSTQLRFRDAYVTALFIWNLMSTICLCFTLVPSAAGVDHEVSAAESAAAEYVRGCRVEWKSVWISVSGQGYRKEHPGARDRETSQAAATAAESSTAAKGKNPGSL